MKKLFPKSIFMKFTLAFVVAGLLPLAFFTGITLSRFTEASSREALNSAHQVLSAVYDSLNTQVYDLNRQTTNMYRYSTQSSGSLYEILKQNTAIKANALKDFTNTVLDSNASIRNVLFLDLNNGVYSSQYPYTKNIDPSFDFLAEPYIVEALAAPRNLHVSTPHKESYYQRSQAEVITFCRVLLDMNELPAKEVPAGILLIDVPYSFLENAFSQFDWSLYGTLYVKATDGSVIYSTGDIENKNSDMVLRSTLQRTGWEIVFKLDPRALLKGVYTLQGFAFVMIAISALGAIGLAIFCSQRLALPIKQLLNQMKKVKKGDLTAHIETHRTDELGELEQGFNQMVVDLNAYIDRSFLARLKQQEAEMNELKMQIHPHFLYNTLEVIRMSALEKNDEDTADMIKALAKLLKYIISELKDQVPLKYEIEMVRDYINLVSLRYGQIHFNTKVSPDLLNCPVPKLVLQPLIENAVQHGLRPKGGGSIQLTVETSHGNLVFTIMDDGVGMDGPQKTRLEELMASQSIGEKTETGWDSIGLKNVNDRVLLAYGKGFGLSFDSIPGVGTAVILTIPYKEATE